MNQDVPDKQVLTAGRMKSSPRGRQAARDILLLAAAASISPEIKERISGILDGAVDWKYLLDLAETHSITPLIAHTFLTSGLIKQIPQPYSERLNNDYHNNLYKNVILSDELSRLISIFHRFGIPIIPLKGTILAEQLYGNPGLRTVADIDIVVQPDKLSPASSLLLEIGYQQSASKQTWDHPFHEAPYYKRGQLPFTIELHRELENPRLVTIPHDDIWRRAQELKIQGETVLVLSPEDNLLYLANNFSKPDNFILKSLCDITELLKKYDGIMDWDYIMDSACSWQIKTSVYFSLKLARDILGAPVNVSIIQALKPRLWRRGTLEFLVSQKDFVSPIKRLKLRTETYVIVRGLMMKHARQTLLVLEKYRGAGEKWPWLRTVIWIILVFVAALGKNIPRVISGR
jgi:hypothetical protein